MMSFATETAPAVRQSFCGATDPSLLAAANINPLTGLSTDYLNHFNEAIMLLEMIPCMPECTEDILAWKPLSYREHFAQSHLHDLELVIAAYDLAEPEARERFDGLCGSMESMIVAAQAALRAGPESTASTLLAAETAEALKPYIAQASAVIHGQDGGPSGPASIQAVQAAVDAVITP
ncbi:MAG: hypothetical protein IT538_05605 [Variibacter sp.]|nr:hypothetical protein [Variibacter sp.]